MRMVVCARARARGGRGVRNTRQEQRRGMRILGFRYSMIAHIEYALTSGGSRRIVQKWFDLGRMTRQNGFREVGRGPGISSLDGAAGAKRVPSVWSPKEPAREFSVSPRWFQRARSYVSKHMYPALLQVCPSVRVDNGGTVLAVRRSRFSPALLSFFLSLLWRQRRTEEHKTKQRRGKNSPALKRGPASVHGSRKMGNESRRLGRATLAKNG